MYSERVQKISNKFGDDFLNEEVLVSIIKTELDEDVEVIDMCNKPELSHEGITAAELLCEGLQPKILRRTLVR